MSYKDFIRKTPKIEEAEKLAKKKAKILQEKINRAVENIVEDEPTAVFNLRQGTKQFEITITKNGYSYTALAKYKVNGKYYITSTDIIEEYGLKSRQVVFNRLHSKSKKWKDWIEL
jgi:hypothetical protein